MGEFYDRNLCSHDHLEKIHITHKHISLATSVTLAESQMFGNWNMAV